MNPALWEELAIYFERVMDMAPAEQQAFLHELKERNYSSWKELDSLLRFSTGADIYIDSLGIRSIHGADAPKGNEDLDPYQFLGKQIGRYQILAVLGKGGMGVVYKGIDTALWRPVALKFLPPLLNAHTESRDRFYIEARAASSLDHPNVCTIYEIGASAEGQAYIAMGYYEGETLSQKLSNGKLPIDKASDYALQIAKGLQAAHQEHIIHRDVKSSNIMVTTDDVVKILDFGLAKVADQQLTQSGMKLGTVAYMSPELIRGHAPSRATDIWAYGVMLYELVTGRRPFIGAIPEAIMYSIIYEDLDIEQDLGPECPASLKKVIAGCLAKDPAKRYDSLHAVVQQLEKPDSFHPGSFTTPRKHWTNQLGLIAFLGAILLAFIVAVWGYTHKYTSTALDTERRIALLPFSSSPGLSEEDQVLAEGVMYMLEELLGHLDAPEHPLTVIPISEVLQEDVRSPEEAEKKLGVNVVIEGELSRLRDVVALSFNLTDPRDKRFIGDDTSLLDRESDSDPLTGTFQEEVLRKMALLLDVPLEESVLRAFRSAQPIDPDAYAYYLQGLGYLHRLYQKNFFEFAIQQFTQSLEKDSLFAPAHAGLCEALFEKYTYTLDVDFAGQALESCDKAADLGDDQAPVLISLGRIYLETGEWEKALQALEHALELDPNNAEAYRWMGRVHEANFDLEQAVANYEKAISLKTNHWLYYLELGMLYGAHNESGYISKSAEQFEIVKKLTPDNYLATINLAVVQLEQGEVEAGKATFQDVLRLRPGDIYAHRLLGMVLIAEQSYQAALDTLQTAAARGDMMGLDFLGRAYFELGEPAKADSVWRLLTQKADEMLEVDPTNMFAQISQANAYAELGNLEKSIALLEAISEERKGKYPYMGYIAGRIYEKNNQRDKALEHIERAFRDHFYVSIMETDPVLTQLRLTDQYKLYLNRFYSN